MSDQASNRPGDLTTFGAGQGKNDSVLRLVTADGSVVLPEGVEPSDSELTIISKSKPPDIQPGSPAASANLHGRMLAHFELLEPIGSGGMATVLRARDTQLDRLVALKILPPEAARDEENIRRFHQEARAAARLDHENVARVYFCGADQGLHFIAFEFVEGVNLRVYLDQRGPLPVAEAVRIVLQIATGLEHAAARGVVHRDVKPSNIIISPNGRAKLVDMGLARSLGPANDGGLTQSGVTLGTFDYISPEQALEPRSADSRSDIYSLGCTFYHMLTGQAPVPEGTAAKKLHHHQHVAPVDPRALNPAIPDEIAAMLGRMMAKDPLDRYPRPVHLVQHLLQVARKFGGADDVPEGALFLDAPIPGTYRQRPLLLFSLGALALALIVLLLPVTPQPVGSVPGGKTSRTHVEKPPATKDVGAASPSKLKLSGSGGFAINNEQDLVQLFADPGNVTYATLESSLEVPEGGLVFLGDPKRALIIDCKELYEPRTIRFKFANLGKSETLDAVAGLTIESGIITFRNIRFELEAQATPDRVVASLGIKAPSTVTFQNCIFAQKDVPQRPFIPDRKNRVPVASLAIDNPEGTKEKRPRVILEQCSFNGGQVAIGINGPAEVLITDGAFRPYGALFHLHGENQLPASLVMQRCSAFVINGPAFRLDDAASCELMVRNSIFSRPDNAPTEDRDEPDLIRQTDKTEPAVKYEGWRNCYHNLNALWVRPKQTLPEIRTEMEEFLALVREAGGTGDHDSVVLTKETPIWISPTPWKEDSLRNAFKLRPDVKEIRTADLKKGLGFDIPGKLDALPPFVAKEDPASARLNLKANEKLVDPDGSEKSPGVFRTLHKALAFAEPGDVVYIKHGKNTREVAVSPISLIKPGTDVTLKSFPGEAPAILRLDKSQDTEEPAFFRMHDGRLALEQFEFILEPEQANLKSMCVVFMGGNAKASFKNCVVTMRPADAIKQSRRTALSVVTLADPELARKITVPSPRAFPEIQIFNCFLRGEGEVLCARASRSLDLEVTNTAMVLSGSLLGVHAGVKEPFADLEARIRLDHISAFLAEPLLTFRVGKNPRTLVNTRVDYAKNSLFAGLANKPLVLIETDELGEGSRGDFLDWKGDHNVYTPFDPMVMIRPEDGGQPTETWSKSRWDDRYLEANAKVLAVPLNLPASVVRAPWTANQDFYAGLSVDLNSFGAVPYLDVLPKLTAD
jgi:Protein kinase domain